MVAQARYLANFATFLARRDAQERHDRETVRELEHRALGLPDGLELEWLGVSGYRMTHAGQTIFIDPYVSRVSLADALRGRMALPDPARIHRHLARPETERVLGVLIGHTHFDHALDAPAVVARHGCPAYGSTSLQHLLALHGLQQHAVVVNPHRRYELGPFTVSFVPSAHSKLLLGLAVPMDGELTCDHLHGLNPGAYRCGQVYGIRIEVAGMSFYHQGSANLIDDEVPRGGVDVFLAGIAGRSFTDRYWQRIISRLQPRTVVPTHYDDFFRPLDAEMGFTTNVKLARVPDEVARVSREIEVAALPLEFRADHPATAP
jgi:L-ascorbate metabolism protein UlaG (beta-lactamase superfamily)